MTNGLLQSAALEEPARLAAALLAVAPMQLGGTNVRAPPGPERDAWLAGYCALAQQQAPIRIPLSVTDDALEGSLDLSATLATGRPKYSTGLLRAAAGRTMLLSMAERWSRQAVARITTAMDCADTASAFVVISLDEGRGEDEHVPDGLRDRLAFHLVELPRPLPNWPAASAMNRISSARSLFPATEIAAGMIEALVATASSLGVSSNRPVLFAVHAARAHASLDGRTVVDEGDVAAAAALVLAPRATQLPAPAEEQQQDAKEEIEQQPDGSPSDSLDGNSLPDRLIEACASHLPRNLLDALRGTGTTRRGAERGRKNATLAPGHHGRTIGMRKGLPRRGERINLSATLLAAAPWQRVRRREGGGTRAEVARPFLFRRDDLRLYRHKNSQKVTTVFSVDASGSAAVHRLAEAKGAVERLLAESYVRRDRVALVAFRARKAEVILHPTRSLARARRALAELPGGGATPLACGIREAHALAKSVLRSGQQCHIVLLTDGCANVDIEGRGGRLAAIDDAHEMARHMRADGIAGIVIDTSPKPGQQSLALAEALGALYVPLPHGSAENICEAVRQFGRADRVGARAQFA